MPPPARTAYFSKARKPGAGRDVSAVCDVGNELCVRVERLEACRRKIEACDHTRFARDDLGLGGQVRRNDGIGGDVAGLPEILFERRSRRAFDGKGRQFELGGLTAHALRLAAHLGARSRSLTASPASISASASVNRLRRASFGSASG